MFFNKDLDGILATFNKTQLELENFIEVQNTKISAVEAQRAKLAEEVNTRSSDVSRASKVLGNISSFLEG